VWILFSLLLSAEQYYVHHQGPYMSLEECFKARDFLMEQAPKPKVNYESVCIKTDVFGKRTWKS